MLVMLRGDWPADVFHRGPHVFSKGIPVDVDDATIALLAKRDLGNSLVLVNPTNAKADHAATAQAQADCDAFLKSRPTPNTATPAADVSHAEQTSAAAKTPATKTTSLVEPPPKIPRRKVA